MNSSGEMPAEARVVMRAALYVGSRDLKELAHFTGVPNDQVRLSSRRVRAAGVWARDGTSQAACGGARRDCILGGRDLRSDD